MRLSSGYYYGRASSPREVLFEDRTRPHADNVGNGVETTAAVGVLKAIHGATTPAPSNNTNTNTLLPSRVVKDVVCFDAHDYEKVVEMLKLDVYEPPVAQVKWCPPIIQTQVQFNFKSDIFVYNLLL